MIKIAISCNMEIDKKEVYDLVNKVETFIACLTLLMKNSLF